MHGITRYNCCVSRDPQNFVIVIKHYNLPRTHTINSKRQGSASKPTSKLGTKGQLTNNRLESMLKSMYVFRDSDMCFIFTFCTAYFVSLSMQYKATRARNQSLNMTDICSLNPCVSFFAFVNLLIKHCFICLI